MKLRIALLIAATSLAPSWGCSGEGDEESSSGSADASSASATATSEDASGGEAEGSSESTEEETGEPPGAEYGPCESIVDCPEGMLYVCLQDVTEGAVCAPGCMEHADCPPPPPGGSLPPVCTLVDDRTRCAILGCQSDEDCPTGMSCHIEGPNWCHWPF